MHFSTSAQTLVDECIAKNDFSKIEALRKLVADCDGIIAKHPPQQQPTFYINTFDDGNDKYINNNNVWIKKYMTTLPPGKVMLVNCEDAGVILPSISEWKVSSPRI